MIAESFGMRCGRTNSVINSSTKRARVVRFGARCRQRLLMMGELLLEQQEFCGDGARAARTVKFRDGYEQVNYEKQLIAHGLHVITPANIHKAAPQGLFALHFCEFAPCRTRKRTSCARLR